LVVGMLVTRWSDVDVGETIMVTTDERTFVYRVDGKDWQTRSWAVSMHRPPRKRRETTTLFSVQWMIKHGMIRKVEP